jgi:hypothetical protein
MSLTFAISLALNLLLFVSLSVAVFYLFRFIRIIMILEDDFSEAIEGLEMVEQSLDKLLKMQLFFDSKEVKIVVQEAMGELKEGRIAVNRLIQKFVQRSKQKYVVIQEEESAPPSVSRSMNMGIDGIGEIGAERLGNINGLPHPSMVDVKFISSTNRME